MKIKAKEKGKVIIDLRKGKILGSKDLCDAVDISEPTLRSAENGNTVSKTTAQKIADYFEKDIKELFEVK